MQLKKKDYRKIMPLIKCNNEISVLSLIEGKVIGEIYVNQEETPTSALIKTSECNYVVGDPNDKKIHSIIREKLDFWDTLTFDTDDWDELATEIHPNRFIKKYKRRRYVLSKKDFQNSMIEVPEDYVLEKVIPEEIRNSSFENADEISEWLENFNGDDDYLKYGSGVYLRNNNTIVAFSLTDCAIEKRVAIGIHTDERYRKQGFGKLVVQENIRQCIVKGYEEIEWLCVDTNIGSIALAESLGFKLNNIYYSYTPYAPIENLSDLTESEWQEWAEHFEMAAKEDKRYFEECLYTYVKANNSSKVCELVEQCDKDDEIRGKINHYVSYLRTYGMATKFDFKL